MAKRGISNFDKLASRFQAIITNAIDGVITINETDVIESINSAALNIFGYEQNDVLGCTIDMLMLQPVKSPNNKYIGNYSVASLCKISGKGIEVVGKRKNGSTFPFIISISEVIHDNKKIFICVIHDITELKEITEALTKERELIELKSRFVTLASHEFRTPLSTILSSVS